MRAKPKLDRNISKQKNNSRIRKADMFNINFYVQYLTQL